MSKRRRPVSVPTARVNTTARQRPKKGGFRFPGGWLSAVLSIAFLAVIGVLVLLNSQGGGANAGVLGSTPKSGTGAARSGSSAYPYQVASPPPGSPAPALALTATDGSKFDLSSLRGKRVLLFFQEGIACEGCWTQMKDIEAQWPAFSALGIDRMVTVTGDPLSPLKQKVALEGVKTMVLADPNLQVSAKYGGNTYGMMGTSADGHSFILVGPDGNIEWRADYGGPPNYTMYVPVSQLLADIKQGIQ